MSFLGAIKRALNKAGRDIKAIVDPDFPLVSLGNVFLDCESIEWSMQSGTRGTRIDILVSKEKADELIALSNPVQLRIACRVYTDVAGAESASRQTQLRGAKPPKKSPKKMRSEKKDITIEEVYILEMKSAGNPWQAYITISDQRHRWEENLVTREYNKSRGINVIDEVVKAKKGNLQNATNVQRFNRNGYAPHTLRNKDSFRFSNSESPTAKYASKWSAMNIVRNLLEEELGLESGTNGRGGYKFHGKPFDNDHFVDNLIFEMSPLTNVLAQMLGAARANIYQHPDGHIMIYSLDDQDDIKQILGNFQGMEGSGWPLAQDLKNVRPGVIRVLFPQAYEIKFTYKETGSARGSVSNPPLSFGLDNVAQVPDTFEVTVRGEKRKYIKGQFVKIDELLEAWNNDPNRPFKGKASLSNRSVRVSWFADKLKYVFAATLANRDLFDLVWERRMQAIERSFRQMFRLPSVWLDKIRTWEPYRVAITDPLTGTRAPAPVFMNYCKVPSFRLPLYKKGYKGKHKAAYNVKGYSSKTDDAYPSPFLVTPVNKDLGVFRIDYANDALNLISSTIPSEVDGIPPLSANSSPGDILWHGASLTANHNMDVILSVVLAEPNDERRHYQKTYDLPAGDNNKRADIPVRMESARYEWKDGASAQLIKNKVFITGLKLANEEILDAIGQAEAKRYANNWQNQTIGVFTQPGWKEAWTPSGTMRSVTIKFSGRRGLETIFNLSERAQRQDIFDLLPQSMRRQLYKQLDLKT